MKLKKIISGGQTGVDQVGLRVAKAFGIPTGGWAPRGWKTEDGPAPWLRTEYGLRETIASDYRGRTTLNVRDADVTIWFGSVDSPGYKATVRAAQATYATRGNWLERWLVNPTIPAIMKAFEMFGIVNIAGNRLSRNPQAAWETKVKLETALAALGREKVADVGGAEGHEGESTDRGRAV